MYEIKTAKFIKIKKVLIDGKEFNIRAAGAGEELALSQGQRRLEYIENIIKAGKATLEDIEKAEEIEARQLSILKSLFSDGTEDNKTANEFIENTPLSMLYAVLDEIKKQSEGNSEASGDQTAGQSESSSVPKEQPVQS